MATAKKKKKTSKSKAPASKKDVLIVDFSDTESRGGKKSNRSKHYKPGDYLVKITKAGKGKSEDKKTPFISFTFKFLDGEYKGDTIERRFYLTPKALFMLRNCIEATGNKVPSKRTKIVPKQYIGSTLAISIDDDEWEDDDGNARVKSAVVDTFLSSELEQMESAEDVELEDDDDEEEESEDADEDEDEDEDEDTEDTDDDDIEDVDLEEL